MPTPDISEEPSGLGDTSPSQASASQPALRSGKSAQGSQETLSEAVVKPASLRDVTSGATLSLRIEPLKLKKKDGVDGTPKRQIPAIGHLQSTGPKQAGDWEPYVHPKGQPYFRFKNFYTNVFLEQEDDLKYIDMTVEKLLDEIGKHPELVLENIEGGLCLLYDREAGGRCSGYYLADKVKEEVFWLEDVDEDYMNESEGVSILGQEHMRLIARHLYWLHVYAFPHGRKYLPDQVAEFQTELNYWMFDKGLSLRSNIPYSTEEIDIFKRILNDIPRVGLSTQDTMPTKYVTVLAKLNYMLAYTRFVRYYEQHRNSVQDTESALWLKIIFWLLFTPPNYTKRLRVLSMDNEVVTSRWSTFATDLREDWANSMTPTTVILAANVGFLAIQSVDNDKGQAYRSAGQIISYISLLLSIGNIFACVILGGILHRSLIQSSPDALEYLFEHLDTDAGRKKVAIILSIPTAFFLWGLLTFLMSIIWMCFYDTGITTRLVVGYMILVSAYLIGTAFYMGHRPEPYFGISTARKYIATMSRSFLEKVKNVKNVKKVGRKSPPSDSNHQNPPTHTNAGGDRAPEPDQGQEIGKNSPRRSSDAVTTGVLPHLAPRPSPTSADSSTPNPLGSTDGALQVDGSEDGGRARETKRSSVEEMV